MKDEAAASTDGASDSTPATGGKVIRLKYRQFVDEQGKKLMLQ